MFAVSAAAQTPQPGNPAGGNETPAEFVVPPPPPPPAHPMAQSPDLQSAPEDLRSPRQKLYESCLDRMADIPGAPEDYVQRCMGEQPQNPPGGSGSPVPGNAVTPATSRPAPSPHPFPGHSVKTLEKQTSGISDILSGCYNQLLAGMRKRNMSAAGDTTVSIFLRDNGRIEAAQVEDSEIVDEVFLNCLERSLIKSWKVSASTSAPPKRNALNNASLVLSFEPGHPKGKVLVTGPKRVRLGGLSGAEIGKSLEKQAVQLRTCKAGALPPEVIATRNAGRRDGEKAVIVIQLDVDFVIDEKGRVTSLNVTELSGTDPKFKKCITDRMNTWTFPKPRGRQKTPVSQSLKLTPV